MNMVKQEKQYGYIIYYHSKLERLRLDIMVSAIEKVENPEILALAASKPILYHWLQSSLLHQCPS